jgi:hypothetical protein
MAAECRALAKVAKSKEAQRQLSEIAEKFERLAAHFERKGKTPGNKVPC